MATTSAARSICRSTPFRSAATKLISGVKPSRSGAKSANNALSRRIFRCPAELSVCVETMQPFHTATASALMTSMLSTSFPCYVWVSDGFYLLGLRAQAEANSDNEKNSILEGAKAHFQRYKLQTSNDGALEKQNMMPHNIIARWWVYSQFSKQDSM